MDLNLKRPLAVIGVFVGGILLLGLVAGFLPSIFANTKAVGENFTNADVGSTQANAVVHVFGWVVPLAIVLGLVGIVIGGVWVAKKMK